jgi:tRNA U34 2-thiouridine synthase MnmA/TrmU
MAMSKSKAKGVGLLSGGLDSILAAKILQAQDVDVICVTFATFFFDEAPGMKAGNTWGIPVYALDIGKKHFEMLKKPVYGYGRWMNPCIDCHALMLREAGRYMEEEGADFLFTGEVLGQRPMSQRRDALRIVENLAGYPGRILRPLSAMLLPPTIPELDGLIDRDRLLDIHGRSRKRQMALAEILGITAYPQPTGGCVLTNEGFGKKLRTLLKYFPCADSREVELLKWGRHFLLPEGSLCTIGRNQRDNDRVESLVESRDILISVADYPGPVGLLLPARGFEKDLELATLAVIAYSDAPPSGLVTVRCRHMEKTSILSLINLGKDYFRRYQI